MLTTTTHPSATRVSDEAARRPTSVHHAGWVVADHERNRHFIEDLLGLPLIATFADESTVNPGLTFSHCVFELGDGNTLAFFQMDGPGAEHFPVEHHNRFNHVALRADERTQREIHERLLADGHEHFIQDHGWTISLYVTSPDGINMEIASDTPLVRDVFAKRGVDPHGDLERWLAGDHSSNSDVVANPEPIRRFPGKARPVGEPPAHSAF